MLLESRTILSFASDKSPNFGSRSIVLSARKGYFSGYQNKRNIHKIGKSAVALWIAMTQKILKPHFKALNVSLDLEYQILQKL